MFSLYQSMRWNYLLVRAARILFFALFIKPETGQRYSVVVSCSCSFPQDCVPYVFIGHCEPASVQLLYVICLILVGPNLREILGIRALPNPELGGFNFDGYNNVAVLRYHGAPHQFPPDPSQNVPVIHNPLIETNLHVS